MLYLQSTWLSKLQEKPKLLQQMQFWVQAAQRIIELHASHDRRKQDSWRDYQGYGAQGPCQNGPGTVPRLAQSVERFSDAAVHYYFFALVTYGKTVCILVVMPNGAKDTGIALQVTGPKQLKYPYHDDANIQAANPISLRLHSWNLALLFFHSSCSSSLLSRHLQLL